MKKGFVPAIPPQRTRSKARRQRPSKGFASSGIIKVIYKSWLQQKTVSPAQGSSIRPYFELEALLRAKLGNRMFFMFSYDSFAECQSR